MISLQNVTVQKDSFTILDNLSFDVGTHEHCAIVGANGAGKSTLLDLLAGKIFVTKGTLQKPLSHEIALVPRDYSFSRLLQATYLYYQQRFNAFDADVAPTLREAIQGQVKPVGTVRDDLLSLSPPAYPNEAVEQMTRLLKIDHLLDQKIVTLSNGETRRALLTTALLKRPKVLLLDNPFVGLDVASRQLLHEVLDTITDTQIVLVTNPNEIPKSVSKVLVLENGRLKTAQQRPFAGFDIKNEGISIDQNILKKLKQESSNADFESALRFDGVTVRYGQRVILSQVHWHVRKGEKWALIGPNGSGKSTLLSLITADNPQAYQAGVTLFDRPRGSGKSIWDIKKRIGFVSPELHLFFDRSTVVWKVVASGLFDSAGLFRKLTPEQHQQVEDYLQLFGLKHLSDRCLSQLSTGQQRLIFLLRALIKNPPLLILDEPCQGLDYDQMVRFRDLINELAVELNKTLIYVTHYEDEIPPCVQSRKVLTVGEKC